MKKLNIFITFILVLLMVACTQEPEKVTVTFDSMGGSDVAAVEIDVDTKLTELPDAPVKEGYRFVHWYDRAELFEYDFDLNVKSDITLKAYYVETVTLSFVVGDGSAVEDVVIDKGDVLETVPESTLDGYDFEYWYLDNEKEEFDFSVAIDADVELTAKWDLTTLNKIALDIEAYEANMMLSSSVINTPSKGEHYKSNITYITDSVNMSKNGVIVPLDYGETEKTETFTVKFFLDGETVIKDYDISIPERGDVTIATSRILDFENMSTEYSVDPGQLEVFYENGGSVPYVKITDFFDLLEGFIDPELDMTITKTDTTLTMAYQYYDEDEDVTYDLELVVDSETNTFTTSDSGFYWAYVYSTETNYGRNIEYLSDHELSYFSDTVDVVYDLDEYNMDIVMKDGEVVVPFYIANQLFVGPSYYNVYYNYDELVGIYLLPDEGSKEYRAMHGSSQKGEDVPVDLLDHTMNMLAFDLDYLYGLKDIMGVDTYYALIDEMKDDLLTQNSNDLDSAISNLLLRKIDEPHTSYGYMSYYSSEEPSTSSLSDYGPRFVKWYSDGLDTVNDVILSRFGGPEQWPNATNGYKPDYWLLDSETAMVTFNGFDTADLYESASHDETNVSYILDLETTDFDLVDPVGTYYYYYNSSSLSEDLLEVLVKGVDATYIATYGAALEADGYTHVTGDAGDDDYKTNGYYTKDITLADSSTVSVFVLVSFDDEYDLFYVGVALELPTEFGLNWPLQANVYDLVQSDSAVYIDETLENVMAEQPGTTNIILDLSWNTGGNVGALYRVLGYVTDQPFTVSGMNRGSGSEYTNVVSITKPNPYNQLNWALLTTPVTFSAANSMTKIFMENDLGPVIGVTTGGGACSITPILLPNGTAFTMSSNSISAIRTGSGTEEDPWVYNDVEFGVVPDIEININSIYSANTLLQVFDDAE